MPNKRRGRAGNTIPQAAQKLGMDEGQLRRAVGLGEVNVVTFAGLTRITDDEIKRIAGLLGVTVLELEQTEKSALRAKPASKAKAKAKAKAKPRSARRAEGVAA